MPAINQIRLSDIQDGDRVEACFDPPIKDKDFGEITKASGLIRTMVGKVYLMADSHRKSWQMSAIVELEEGNTQSLQLIETASDLEARRKVESRGDLVFQSAPSTPEEVEQQLITLAQMMMSQDDKVSRRGRYAQLRAQFDDIAELVSLAGRKRNYLLCKVRLGQDFNPWTWPDDRVYRNETVRPLPVDFDLDSSNRKDRQVRLDQSIRIFGEAEREVRTLASRLRKIGYNVRRPHPNAQQLLISFPQIEGKAELKVLSTDNGLWYADIQPSSNKTEAKAMARLRKSGLIDAFKLDLERILKEALTQMG